MFYMLSILEKKYEKDWENIYKNTNKSFPC